MKDKYYKYVEWSEEDKCYVGYCPEIMGAACHGQNQAQVFKELCTIVDEYIKIYKQDDKPLPPSLLNKKFSGKFNLRINPELHKQITVKSLEKSLSLNQFCEQALESKI